VKKLLFFSVLTFILVTLNAAIITVSNGNNSIADYSDLQTALDNANPGDTIYIYGSDLTYGDITINQPIKLMGPGHNPEILNMNKAEIGNIVLETGASGAVISGIYQNQKNITAASGVNNVLVENNFIYSGNDIHWLYTVNNDNWIYRGNLFAGMDYYYSCKINLGPNDDNWLISNNIFTGDIRLDSLNATTIFSNNLFIRSDDYYSSDQEVFYRSSSSLIQNNIFVSTTNNSYWPYFESCNTCTYNNNLTWSSFGGAIDSIPGTDDSGSGNIIFTNPAFVDFPTTEDFSFSYEFDVHLNDTSPAKFAGTDGTELGPYGGSSPISLIGNTSLPRALIYNIKNPILQQGDSIIINIKATSAQ